MVIILENDLQRLQRLRNEGYRLTEIHISFNKEKTPSEVAELFLKREQEEIVMSSSEPELFSYVIHLKSVPHIEDDNADFVYVEDGNRYFDIQKKILDLLSGEAKEFVIHELVLENFQEEFKKIRARSQDSSKKTSREGFGGGFPG
jgi:hypothetical protein